MEFQLTRFRVTWPGTDQENYSTTFAPDAKARDFTSIGRGSFARYQDSLEGAIVLLKFEEMEPLADWFSDRLAEVVLENHKELD